MATSFLPFLDAVTESVNGHGIPCAIGFRHHADTDELHVVIASGDVEYPIVFEGQLVSDFADDDQRRRVLAVIDERIAEVAARR